MDDVFAARVMSAPVHTVGPETLVADAAGLMLEEDIGAVVVADEGGRLEGILTSTDFVRIVSESRPKAETAVARYMTTDVVTVTPQVPIRHVAETMQEHGVHHLPVVDEEGSVIGIVTSSDLTAYLSESREEGR